MRSRNVVILLVCLFVLVLVLSLFIELIFPAPDPSSLATSLGVPA